MVNRVGLLPSRTGKGRTEQSGGTGGVAALHPRERAGCRSGEGLNAQPIQQPLREAHRPLLVVDAHMGSGAGGEELLLSGDLVGVAQLAGFQFLHAGMYGDFLIVTRGSGQAALEFRDREVVTAAFQLGVRHTDRPHVFRTAAFKPHQVVGVVDDAHLIGFGVPGAQVQADDS